MRDTETQTAPTAGTEAPEGAGTTNRRTGAPDFADVYADHLGDVWRYVRARIPDHHEAHDVTSDVFVRAWRAWDRFDAVGRRVEPWLFTIASRAVADWWRARRPVHPTDPSTLHLDLGIAANVDGPEPGVLREELLTQLGRALEGLNQRERDALALRFAAKLSSPNVAAVLGCSTSAAKMLVHRAIARLRGQDLDELDGLASGKQPSADLEAIIDDVLDRGHDVMSSSELHGLLVHLAVAHEAPVPPDLGQHVAHCVRCAADEDVSAESDDRSGGGDGPGGGHGVGGGLATRLPSRLRSVVRSIATVLGVAVFGPLCAMCGIAGAYTLVVALGFSGVQMGHHYLGMAAGPVVAIMAWRAFRRTGAGLGWTLARIGIVTLAVHVATHAYWEATGAPWEESALTRLFELTDAVATVTLAVAAVINLVEINRWRQQQYDGLQTRAAAPTG